ncbi:MAG: GspH/FimT family pseudopilin [Pseudomonas sp.]
MRGRKGSRGFTLIEMLVVVVLLAIFATIALPSFTKMIGSNRVQSTSEEIFAAVQFARMEANSHQVQVSACLSATVIRVVTGADCSITDFLRKVETPPSVSISSGSASVLTFQPDGTASANVDLVVCRDADVTTGQKLSVGRSGYARLSPSGKNNNDPRTALTACTL